MVHTASMKSFKSEVHLQLTIVSHQDHVIFCETHDELTIWNLATWIARPKHEMGVQRNPEISSL